MSISLPGHKCRKEDCSDLEVTVLVDKDIAWFLEAGYLRTKKADDSQVSHQVSVDNTSRMYIFESALVGIRGDERGKIKTYQDLVKEVLDELFFEWPRCKETMKIGAKQLGDEISGTSISDQVGSNQSIGSTNLPEGR